MKVKTERAEFLSKNLRNYGPQAADMLDAMAKELDELREENKKLRRQKLRIEHFIFNEFEKDVWSSIVSDGGKLVDLHVAVERAIRESAKTK